MALSTCTVKIANERARNLTVISLLQPITSMEILVLLVGFASVKVKTENKIKNKENEIAMLQNWLKLVYPYLESSILSTTVL